jgi:hypothetical protein
LIRKGRVRFQGETIRIQNFELWYAPRHREVPMYLSAVFPKGVALCGEVADGIILTRSTLRTAASVRIGTPATPGPPDFQKRCSATPGPFLVCRNLRNPHRRNQSQNGLF